MKRQQCYRYQITLFLSDLAFPVVAAPVVAALAVAALAVAALVAAVVVAAILAAARLPPCCCPSWRPDVVPVVSSSC